MCTGKHFPRKSTKVCTGKHFPIKGTKVCTVKHFPKRVQRCALVNIFQERVQRCALIDIKRCALVNIFQERVQRCALVNIFQKRVQSCALLSTYIFIQVFPHTQNDTLLILSHRRGERKLRISGQIKKEIKEHKPYSSQQNLINITVLILTYFKGTVSRDFRLLVFFMNQLPPSPGVYH